MTNSTREGAERRIYDLWGKGSVHVCGDEGSKIREHLLVQMSAKNSVWPYVPTSDRAEKANNTLDGA